MRVNGVRRGGLDVMRLPREIATGMRPHLANLAGDMMAEIQRQVPEFAHPDLDRVHRLAVEGALHQFMNLIEDPESSWEKIAEVYRGIGAWEADGGRGLDALQQALRTGARVAWRRVCEQADTLRLSQHELGILAEAIFLFLDEIAAAASEGYLTASERAAGEKERRRRRLLDLLLTDPPPATEAVTEAARIAGWTLPRTVAGVALHERRADRFRPPSLPPDVLVAADWHEPYLLLPDPDGPGRGGVLDSVCADWIVAVGPTVPTGDAAKSLGWAREALRLAERGIITADGPVRCADHEATMVVFRDEDFIRTVAETRLAPLLALRPAQRERLAETLLACLQRAFNANEAAERLHIHPQTVRYRLRQLEELFGDRLYDPGRQMALEMALHAWLTANRT